MGKLVKSFTWAIRGLLLSLQEERNMKIHLLVAIGTIILSFALKLSKAEFAIILLAIALVLVSELLNSALERVVDVATDSYHPLAKDAKDIAAGGVLISSIIAALVGIIILLPPLIGIWK